MSPEDSPLQSLNENYIVSIEDGKVLRLWGDSAGVEMVEAILYKNSGFRAGHVRVSGDVPGAYSKLSCTVTELASAPPKETPKKETPKKKPSGARCLTNADCASGTCIRGIAEYSCM